LAAVQQEQIKLELAAVKIVELVGASVGWMLYVEQIVLYGNTEHCREKIYKTLESYGYAWQEERWVKQEGKWALTISPWIHSLVADTWHKYEISRD